MKALSDRLRALQAKDVDVRARLSAMRQERDTFPVEGIRLLREGEQVVVEVQSGGDWYPVIHEHHETVFDHVVTPDGIRDCLSEDDDQPYPAQGERGDG